MLPTRANRTTPTLPRRAAAIALAATVLVLGACGSDDDATDSSADVTAAMTDPATTATPSELAITDVWARQSPMGTTAGAIYLDITSPIDDQLLAASVSTEIAGDVQIHETVQAGEPSMGSEPDMGGDGGAMTMQEVDAIDLPAGTTVSLEPGGYHVMLLDLVAPLTIGQEIEVTLTFAEAGEVRVTAEVRAG